MDPYGPLGFSLVSLMDNEALGSRGARLCIFLVAVASFRLRPIPQALIIRLIPNLYSANVTCTRQQPIVLYDDNS